MIQYFSIIDQHSVAVDKPESATWINVLPPLKEEEFSELSSALSIPLDFLKDSLDIDERSRFETEKNVKLIVIKTPTENNSFNDSDAFYITIPICIILTGQQVVTVNSFENAAIKKFLNSFQNRQPDKPNMMVLKIFEKVIINFQECLKEINQRRNMLEQKLFHAIRNEELQQLMRIQKSLVYFLTALRSNELLMMKLTRSHFFDLDEKEKDLLDDLIVETSQALETANIYTNILGNTLGAFGNIINNNQNEILKRLSNIIILLSIPILIAGIYGMKFPLPYQRSPYAFWFPVTASVIILCFVIFIYRRRTKK